MSGILLVILIFFIVAAAVAGVAYFTYQQKLRRAKAIERGLKMVPILIHLPPPSSDTEAGGRDIREVMREKTSQAETLYNLLGGTATEGFKSKFYGQRHLALEVVAVDGVVHFYAAVPVALVSVVSKAVQTAYPGARLEEVEDHNIFNQEGRLAATLGGEMVLRQESAYPIATYSELERDPMEGLINTVTSLEKKDGAAIQIMIRPAARNWTVRSKKLADGKRKGRSQNLSFSAMDLAKAAIKSPDQWREEERARMGGGPDISNLQLAEIEKIEEKTKHPGFEVLIRVLVSTQSVARSQQLLRDIATTFALFETPGLNGFKFLPALDVQGLVTAFIFRFFPPEIRSNVLNSVELATLFHLPDSQFTPNQSVERQRSKQVDGPVQLPTAGLLFGHNEFRGIQKEIRLSNEDRRRHTYILGQTGTGKSTLLENLALQDMLNGNGFAFIDPHGDSAEKLLAMVPKERAEDIVYFNPADTNYPLGLNLFEFTDAAQKDFLVQETIGMLYKLYDPGKTGIIGPRYEHWYRNAALTLMSDPNGSTFIEIPKVFTDTDYLKQKFKYLRDPTVIDFWIKEMGQTSDYHKSEMLGWFVSKFGAFQNNEMMRNIIGQTRSSFNLREIMDKKKILIVNLSKGKIGELNSQLLGMIFVIKFQAAAMSRADVLEDQREDFCLYVDEFQNFSTDSFASILSEARKYRLNLVVANQFIGQLSDEIRDAVFGNIGTIIAHRMGPDDGEFMVKQFAPVFDASDLVNIPNFNSAVRLMIGGLPSQPFTMRDLAPLGTPNLELGLAIKQLSAAKYGHSKSVVEADIAKRLASTPSGAAPAPAVPAAPPVAFAPAMPLAQPAPAQLASAVSQPAPMPASVPVAPAPTLVAPTVQSAPAAQPLASPQQAVQSLATPQPLQQPMTARPTQPVVAPTPVASTPVAVAQQQPVAVQPRYDVPPVQSAVPFTQSQAPAAQAVSVAPVPAAVAYASVPAQSAELIPPAADPTGMEGGFSDFDAPIGAPQAGVPAASDPLMMATPPPIGAPPVDLPGVPIVQPQPQTDPQVSAMPQVAVVAEQAVAPTTTYDSMPPVNPFNGAGPVLPSASAAAVPNVLPMTPLPIGAPPVGLSSAPQTQLPAPQAMQGPLAAEAIPPIIPIASTEASASDPSTLSFADITGRRSVAPAPQNLSSVPVMASVMAPPVPQVEPEPVQAVAPQPAPAAPQSASMADPTTPLGSGQALEGDPYANIELLGDLTLAAPVPAPAAATVPPQPEQIAPVSQPVTSPSGVPFPSDPNAAVNVLGESPGFEQPTAPQMSAAAAATMTPTASMPASASLPIATPAYQSVPVMPPTAFPAAPVPQFQATPLAQVQPASQAPQPLAEIAPIIMSAPPAVPAVATMPLPVPAPVAAASSPAVTPYMPAPVSPAPAPAPVAIQAPQAPVLAPTPVEPTIPAATPAPTPVVGMGSDLTNDNPDEPFIHFVDPAAEAVLNRPDGMGGFQNVSEEQLLMNGLPEGVHVYGTSPGHSLDESASAPAPAAMTVSPTPTPIQVTSQPISASLPPVAPVAVAPVVSAPPMPSAIASAMPVTPPEATYGMELQAPNGDLSRMATAPPPIGAAPVEIAPQATVAEAAVPSISAEPLQSDAPPAVVPQIAFVPAVSTPDTNAALVERMQHSGDQQVNAQSQDNKDDMQSVAAMLNTVEPVGAAQAGIVEPVKAEVKLPEPVQVPVVPARFDSEPQPSVFTADDMQEVNSGTDAIPTLVPLPKPKVKHEPVVVSSEKKAVSEPRAAQSEVPAEGPKRIEPAESVVAAPVAATETIGSSSQPAVTATAEIATPAPEIKLPESEAAMPETKMAELAEEQSPAVSHEEVALTEELIPAELPKPAIPEEARVPAESHEAAAAVEERSSAVSQSVVVPTTEQVSQGPPEEVVAQERGQASSQTEPAPSPSEQIEQTEHVIDGLLGQSLLQPESSSSLAHERLPEPASDHSRPEEEAHVDLEMNNSQPLAAPARQAPLGSRLADHHGIKVIQPLEPIVPPKELFAKELAALNEQDEGAQDSTDSEQKPPSAKLARHKHELASPVATPKKPIVPAVPVAKKTNEELTVSGPTEPIEGNVIRHEGHPLPVAPASQQAEVQTETWDESALPQAESLAANDVARARAEREAQETLNNAQAAPDDSTVMTRPAEPRVQAEQPKPAEARKTEAPRPQKHRRLRREKPAEVVSSEAEDAHNRPTEAEQEHGAMTGKLIMPSGDKPKPEPEPAKLEKPKKLAPGEVFVDEHGNVVIGE